MLPPLNSYRQSMVTTAIVVFTTLLQPQVRAAELPNTLKQGRKSPAEAIEALKQKLEETRVEVANAQNRVDALRHELRVVEFAPDVEAEIVRRIEGERMTAAAQAAHYESIVKKLSGKSHTELREILPTVQPDENLADLLSRLSKAVADLHERSAVFGEANPQYKTVQSLVANLESQADKRVRGIMEGLSTLAHAYRAREAELKKQLEQFQMDHNAAVERSRPYFAAKREFETRQRVYESIQLRLLQEQVDAAISKEQDSIKR